MFTFLKAQASSLIATAVDFAVTILLVEFLQVGYLVGTFFGTCTGGITNFLLCKNWVFDASLKPVVQQLVKYVTVWAGSLALNVCLVYIFTDLAGFSYIISKVSASIMVGVCYNFVLQKKYVFN